MLILSINSYSQIKNNCLPVVISDSLFNANTISYHSYAERNGSIAKSRSDANISKIDSVFKLKDGCLQFGLLVSKAHIKPRQFTFVTDNKLKTDSGKKYYHLKIIVNKDDETAAVDLQMFDIGLNCFDMTANEPYYLKINSIPQLIRIK